MRRGQWPRQRTTVVLLVAALAACGRRNFNVDGDTGSLDGAGATCANANCTFTTVAAFWGNLGGLAGADRKCQDEADAAGLVGSYLAWLGTSTVDAANRFAGSRGWIRVDGRVVVKDRMAELTSLGPTSVMSLSATGLDLRTGASSGVWTGTYFGGAATSSCADWTSETIPEVGLLGEHDRGGKYFTDLGTDGCDRAKRLYCFGVGHAAPIPVAVTGRIAFVSSSMFMPAQGVAAADALCAAEAAALGARTFRAALARTNASAAQRYSSPSHDYSRVDGVHIGPLLNGSVFDSFVNLTATGTSANDAFWSAGRAGTTATDTGNCVDWTTPSAGFSASHGDSSRSTAALWDGYGSRPCSDARPVTIEHRA